VHAEAVHAPWKLPAAGQAALAFGRRPDEPLAVERDQLVGRQRSYERRGAVGPSGNDARGGVAVALRLVGQAPAHDGGVVAAGRQGRAASHVASLHAQIMHTLQSTQAAVHARQRSPQTAPARGRLQAAPAPGGAPPGSPRHLPIHDSCNCVNPEEQRAHKVPEHGLAVRVLVKVLGPGALRGGTALLAAPPAPQAVGGGRGGGQEDREQRRWWRRGSSGYRPSRRAWEDPA
jgi:hypothetical protein